MKLTRPDKIGIAGISILIVNILLQTVIFPSILKSKVKKRVVLKNGWPRREIWSKQPLLMELHWYVFTVTNPDEINNGEKPILQEVGPYVYDMLQEKLDLEDHEEDDTVSYTLRYTHYFNKEKSNGLDQDDELMISNTFLLGVPNGITRDRPYLMPIASKAVDKVFGNPKSIFVKASPRTLLFDGFVAHCKGIDDFQGKVLCKELSAYYDEYFILKVGEASFASAIWGPLNATNKMGRARIHRGIKNIKELGKLKEYNQKKNFSAWDTDYCDAFRGTDYIHFPPFVDQKKKENFFASFGFICKTFEFTYDSNVEFEGLQLLRYTTDVGANSESNPEHKCYCFDPKQCPPDGAFDVYKCLGIPLFLSCPHFYRADPYYLRSLGGGLEPNKEKHMTNIDIDPLTGFAVRINTRLQVSLNMQPFEKYRLMKNFPRALLPLAWLNMRTVLPNSIIKEIKACHRIITISTVFNYLLLISGLAMCAYAGYHHYQLRREKQLNTITELSPASSVNHSGGEKKISKPSAAIPTIID